MQQKYLEHYMAMIFHKWFMKFCDQVGDSPFRTVVQNYIYYQDPNEPDKVRLQSFISGLVEFMDKAKDLPDPDPAPPLTVVELDARLKARALEPVLQRPPMDLATFNFYNPTKISLDKP